MIYHITMRLMNIIISNQSQKESRYIVKRMSTFVVGLKCVHIHMNIMTIPQLRPCQTGKEHPYGLEWSFDDYYMQEITGCHMKTFPSHVSFTCPDTLWDHSHPLSHNMEATKRVAPSSPQMVLQNERSLIFINVPG